MAKHSLIENVTQTIADFDEIQDAINEQHGYNIVPDGMPTSEYAEKILDIVTASDISVENGESEVGKYISSVKKVDSTINSKLVIGKTSFNDISLNASVIKSGTIDIDRLPKGALERLFTVNTKTDALNNAEISQGDTVKIISENNQMYYCTANTGTFDERFSVYTAGSATSVPWSGVTGKPSTYPPSSHTHPISQITNLQSTLDSKLNIDGSNGTADGLSALINKLGAGDANMTDATLLVTSHITPSSGSQYYRRPASYLWGYVKGKADAIYQPKGSYLTAITKAQVEAVLTGNITTHTHSQYLTSYTDTKNTAGSTNSNLKLYLVGSPAQSNYTTTYSNANAYVDSSGYLYSGGAKVLTAHQSLANYYTKTEVNDKNYIKVIECYKTTEWSDIRVSSKPLTMCAYDVYGKEAGGPDTFGNVLEIVGRTAHWQSQLWFGSGKDGVMRHRNKDYNDNTWGDWYTLLDSRNYASILNSTYVTLGTAQTISALKTITAGLKVSGRVVGSGDDEGIVIGKAANSFAGLCLGNPDGIRSVFCLDDNNKAKWRYSNGTNPVADILHPNKSGTIALTADLTAYVKKSGDTMTGTLYLGSTSARVFADTTYGAYLQYGSNYINIKDGNPLVNNAYKIWHSGNDGSGSGLDADLLDGVHASEFARGGMAYYIASDGTGPRWIRIATFSHYVATGIISIENAWNRNPNAALIFTFSAGHKGNNNYSITQIGGTNSVFTKARIVYPTATDEAGFIELYYNEANTGNNFLYVRLSNSVNVTLVQAATTGSVPSTHAVYEQAFTANGIAAQNIKAVSFTGALTGNATSATQLQTARTLWGQSFNGTGNVSGSLTGVANISASNYYLYNNAANPYLRLTAGSQIYYCQASQNGISIGSLESKSLLVNSTGDVGIGTLTPRSKLHITGPDGYNALHVDFGGDPGPKGSIDANGNWLEIRGNVAFNDTVYTYSNDLGGATSSLYNDGKWSTYKNSGTYLNANKGNAIINSTAAAGSFVMLAKMNSTNGYFTHGTYQNKYILNYAPTSYVTNSTNSFTQQITLLDEAGNSQFNNILTNQIRKHNNGTDLYIGGPTNNGYITFKEDIRSYEDLWSVTLDGAADFVSIVVSDWIEAHGNVISPEIQTLSLETDKIKPRSQELKIGDTSAPTKYITIANTLVGNIGSGNTWQINTTGSARFNNAVVVGNGIVLGEAGDLECEKITIHQQKAFILDVTTNDYKIKGLLPITAPYFTETSDIRLKTINKYISLNVDDIATAPIFNYHLKDNNKILVGSSAQYWRNYIPEAIDGEETDTTYLSMQYDRIALASAVSIAKETVKLRNQISNLENQIKNLQQQLVVNRNNV